MRMPRLRPVLILVLLAAVLLAAAGLGGAGTAPTAQAAATVAPSHWCNFVLAGKNATTDGSVLMGYNNDWSANNYTYLQVVPGDATHYQFVRILTLGRRARGRHQRAAAGRELRHRHRRSTRAVLAADPYVKKGYGGEIWDLILQKCTTATQAIDAARPDGADRVHRRRGRQLRHRRRQRGLGLRAARRPPLGRRSACPTTPSSPTRTWSSSARSTSSDTANFRGSADLQSFAQSIGRYNPADGPFDVAWAYHDRAELQSYYNTNRLWGAFNSSRRPCASRRTMPYATRPVFVVPDHKLTRQDIAAICRYHYEGTSIDQTAGYSLMSPHDQTNRPICYSTT